MPATKRKAGLPAPVGQAAAKRQAKAAQPEVDAASQARAMMQAAMEDDMMDDEGTEGEDDDSEDASGNSEVEDDASAAFEDIEDEDAAPGPSKPAKGKGKADLYRPPTAEEMRMLREAADRGGSYDFGMKINALLQSTLLQHSSDSSDRSYAPSAPPHALSSILTALHAHILGMQPLPALPVRAAAQRLAPVRIPFARPSPLDAPTGEEPRWTLGWERPKEAFVCGSWGVVGAYKRGIKRRAERKNEVEVSRVDVAVTMPDSMFTPKDRLANRYFHKRAHYLAVIAGSLQHRIDKAKGGKAKDKSGPGEDDAWKAIELSWEAVGGDARRAALVVTVPNDKARGIKHTHAIRVLPHIRPGLFALSALYPTKSNLRVHSEDTESGVNSAPTPLYNQSILLDTTHRAHLLFTHTLAKTCPSFRPALVLWRVWGERRGLHSRHRGGETGWAWTGAMLMGWVINGGTIAASNVKTGAVDVKPKKGLGRGLTEWQLLRAAWEILAATQWGKTALITKQDGSGDTIPPLECVRGWSSVLMDVTGTINVWGFWEQGELDLLCREAKNSLELQNRSSGDSFEELFIWPQQASAFRFDEVFRIDASDCEDQRLLQFPANSLDAPSFADGFVDQVLTILRRAMGTRALLSTAQVKSGLSWQLELDRPDGLESALEIGLFFDPTEGSRMLDQGPASDDAAAIKDFQQLWGDKSELRRFKDGSITESVVWNVVRPEERALIPGEIVKWILQRHFAIPADCLQSDVPTAQKLLMIPASSHRLKMTEGSEKLGFRPAQDAFERLYKVIKAADNELPLSVLNFSPSSQQLRYTSTFVPHPLDLARAVNAPSCILHTPAIQTVIQFESSRRWPDDLVAIQKVKMAFLVKLARLLQEKIPDATANVVLEPEAPAIQDHACLEVVVPEGFVFHIRIYHDRERTLLVRSVDNEDTPKQLRRIALDSLRLHVKRFTSQLRHHAAVSTIHHMHPSYATATRLLQRWLSAHMLSQQIQPEFVELCMASVYLGSQFAELPRSSMAGFVRALYLLAHWRWTEEPRMVPLYTATREGSPDEELAASSIFPVELAKQVVERFAENSRGTAQRSQVGMRFATENDLDGGMFAMDASVAGMVSTRISALARAACDLYEASQEVASMRGIEGLFTTPLDHFDFVITLKPYGNACLDLGVQAGSLESSSWAERTRVNRDKAIAPVVSENPAEQYCRLLQSTYGEQVAFFMDRFGGTVIGGVWNPATAALRNFKPFLGFSARPANGKKESTLVEANKAGMLAEVARLGDGLVSKVEQRQ